jgi:hypothetical protein
VPSANARLGILTSGGTPPSPCPANSTLLDPNANVCVDNNVAKYLPFFHMPNGPVSGNVGQYVFTRQAVVTENYFTVRVDQKIFDKDSLFGTYVYDYSPLTQPDILNNILQQSIAKRQIASVEENHLFGPTASNSIRFGYNRDHANALQAITALNPVANDTSQGWAPGYAPPRITTAGLNTVPGFAPPTFSYAWNAYQVYDDAFVTKGLHTFKFGMGYERDQLNETTATADYLGTFKFASMSNFLQNKPKSVVGSVPGLVTPRYMRISIFGAYLQDDWRIRPRLTLNLGLRYEMSTVPTETKGKLTNLPTLDAATPNLGDPYFSNPTTHNFEPRVGFAWDPFGNGKTALRGGFGMFDVLPMLYTTVTLNGRGAPFYELGSSTSAAQLKGTFPGGALPAIQASTPPLEYGFVEHNPKRNYVMQWNLNVQHEFSGFTASLGYVGSHGVHQAFRADDANMVLPSLTSAGYLWPKLDVNGNVYSPLCNTTDSSVSDDPSCAPPSLVNPNANVGGVRYLSWPGTSSYDALQFGVLKRMSHGLQIQGSFTWGKSLDSNSGVIAGDTFGNGIGSLPWFDMKLSHGVSDYNVGRTVVINLNWQLPLKKIDNSVLSWAANGWEFGAIFKANDGPPFTPTFGTDGDPLGLASTDPWDLPDRVRSPGCASPVNPGNPNNYVKTECFSVPLAPNAAYWSANCDPAPPSVSGLIDPNSLQCFNLRGNTGRNSIPGPGLMNLDISLFKNNYIRRISESFNVQFRAEIFNILNHPNFALPVMPDNTDIFDSTGAQLNPPDKGAAGVLVSTTTKSREIQFALKVIW